MSSVGVLFLAFFFFYIRKSIHGFALLKVGFAPFVVTYDSKKSFGGAGLEQKSKSEGHHTRLWENFSFFFFFSCTLKSGSHHHGNLKLAGLS